MNPSSLANAAALRPSKRAPGLLIALGLSLTLACGASGAHERTAVESAAADPVQEIAASLASTSGGCGKTATHTGEYNTTTTDGDKRTRTYLVQLPSGYEKTRSYPLVFVFHGAGGDAAQAYSWGLQNTPGAAEEAIFIYPNGIPFEGYGIGWDDSKSGYDLPFFDHMVAATEAAYCINPQQIFAVGFSWGGDFVAALACTRGPVVRAVAINSATDEYADKTNSHTYNNSPCPSHVHPHVRFQHAIGGDSQYPAPLFNTTSQLFQRFNTCSTLKTAVQSSFSGMTCYSYDSCSKQLVECSFSSSIGHALPPNWAKDTWAFLATFL